MSKAMLVTWPFVMLLMDYWPLGRFKPATRNPQPAIIWRLVVEKIPFSVLVVVASIVTFVAQKQSGALQTGESLSLGARGGNALISYGRYLGKMFWPTDLAVFYPHPGYWPLEKLLLAGLLIVTVSALLLGRWRQYPFLLMGWLWYLGTLVPVIGLVQAGDQSMADRYTYIPSLGVWILAVWGGYELTRRRRCLMSALALAGLAAIVACLALTRQQLGYWRDSETLFQHTLAITENNHVAHYALGSALYLKGQTDEAINQFRAAIRLKPDYAEARNDLGAALDKIGQTDEAIRQIQEAIRLKPDDAFPHFNFGAALDKKGQTDEAIFQYQEAIRLKPDDAEAHINLGADLGKKSQTDEAIRHLQEAIRLKPDDAGARINLGAALDSKGQTDEAIRQYQEAIRLKPDAGEARNNLGYLWARRGENLDQARALIEKAVQLEPKNAEFLDSLGWVLLKLNRASEALDYQLKAIETSATPDASLYDHLGDIYAALKQRGQAAEAWHKSLSLSPDSQVQKKLDGLSAPFEP
jgi:Flp pilus assembly protein TadD